MSVLPPRVENVGLSPPATSDNAVSEDVSFAGAVST